MKLSAIAVLGLAAAAGVALAQSAPGVQGAGPHRAGPPAGASPPASPAPSAEPARPVVAVRENAMPALVAAARDQQVPRALELLEHGADVNAAAPDGTTALIWAVHYDEVPLIDRLLASHANVRTANQFGATAMSEAAVYGDTGVIRKLLDAGADVESANADGQTALMIIARTSNVEAAKLLIGRGANVNTREKWRGQTALMWAAARSQPAMVRLLLQHHADPNVRSYYDTFRRQVTAEPRVQGRPTGGFTPLIYAARQGCLECAKYLVEGGADVNMIDPDGETPLLMATQNFHFDLAAYLVGQGADVNRWDNWGRTPLWAAVDLNTLPYGGRPDHISLDNTTPLALMRLLLEKGANPNARLRLFPPYRALGPDRGGDGMLTTGATPLLRAAKAGDVDAIKLLLAHGADVTLANRYGQTPLMAAAGLGSTTVDTRGKYKTQKEAVEAIDLLAAAGADVNAADERGDTALHGAASWGWNDVVKCLATHHANLQAKDARGMTPVDAAMGRAVAHSRGTPDVYPETANLLKQLITSQLTTSTAGPRLGAGVLPAAGTAPAPAVAGNGSAGRSRGNRAP